MSTTYFPLPSNITSPENTQTPDVAGSPKAAGTDTDTIVAVATPPGRGGISVLRLSGGLCAEITQHIAGDLPPPRMAALRTFRAHDESEIDHGLLLYFPAPASFTGEDVVEFHGHGSPIVMQMMLRRCNELGARMARPGEFSERAFLNDRLDLAQAEAIADLIESSTEAAARSAVNSLKGEFSERIHALVALVTELRIYVEAAIDFPDEEIDFLAEDGVKQKITTIQHAFSELLAASKRGKIMRDGLQVVLAGLPNAGKSSLLNALGQEQRAIVSDIPGTTRDTLEQMVNLDGLPVVLTDTAGLRDSHDKIEEEGVRRAHQAVASADLVLLVLDDSSTSESIALQDDFPVGTPVIRVYNKIDLTGRAAGICDDQQVAVSAVNGLGLDSLMALIKTRADFRQIDDSSVISRQRHVLAIEQAKVHMQQGVEQLEIYQAGELLAEELSLCQQSLGQITGEITSDDLLGLIFGSFCIGK